MFKTIRGRLITIFVVVAVSVGYLYANNSRLGRPIKLGLDLQGGMHLVLEVDTTGVDDLDNRRFGRRQNRRSWWCLLPHL